MTCLSMRSSMEQIRKGPVSTYTSKLTLHENCERTNSNRADTLGQKEDIFIQADVVCTLRDTGSRKALSDLLRQVTGRQSRSGLPVRKAKRQVSGLFLCKNLLLIHEPLLRCYFVCRLCREVTSFPRSANTSTAHSPLRNLPRFACYLICTLLYL